MSSNRRREGAQKPSRGPKKETCDCVARVESDLRSLDQENEGPLHVEDEERGNLWQIAVAGALFLAGLIWGEQVSRTPFAWVKYAIFFSAYLLVGISVIHTALRNLFHGRVFDENFLLSAASMGAIAIGQLPEAAAVMLFYALGEYLQERAEGRSRRSIAALLDMRADHANLKTGEAIRRVSPEEVKAGQIIVVKPGERVPLDGEVLEGSSFVDTSALTGEPVPRRVERGGSVLAGMLNADGVLTVKVTKPYGESSAVRILKLVEGAVARKAPIEQFFTAFSRYYTPLVVFGALALAVIPPLITGEAFSGWVYRALVLLVISCPCALVISIPLGYFGGIGKASRRGILVKGARFLDALADLHTVVFDKTGTLTKGVFRVTQLAARDGFSEEELLLLAAHAEAFSSHPIARSIREAYGKEVRLDAVSNYQEIAGYGVSALVDEKRVLVGNDRLLHKEGVPHDICDLGGTAVYVVVNGSLVGHIVISDEVKPDAKEAVARLRELGVKRVVMLTGDGEPEARRVAQNLDLDAYFAEMLPEDKVAKVEELVSSLGRRQKLAFVGDGINDAPVIARADVGVAMGGLGSEAAIELADVVLMEDKPSKLAAAVEIAARTGRIVRENVTFALGMKAFFLLLGVLGVATMWEAVFADVGVALITIFNAARALR